MAKKAKTVAPKKSTKSQDTSETVQAVVNSILKEFGDDVVIKGRDVLNQKKVIIPICPTLDIATNGGLQEGSFVTLSGPPRCGKTTTALHFAGTCQQPEWGGRQVIYLNAEARLERRDIEGIGKLDPDKLVIVQAAPAREDSGGVLVPGVIPTAEQYLEIAERFLLNTVRSVVILDSISIMCEESEWTGGIGTSTRGGAQKLFAQFVRRMCQVIPANKHIFIGIVHLMANTSGYGPHWLEKLSNSGQYALATKLRADKVVAWTVGSDKTQIGQTVQWKWDRSPIGKPGVTVTSYLRYGEGIDEIQECVQYATELNMIRLAGAWYNFEFLDGKPKACGAEGVREYFRENPKHFEILKAKVREYMGL